jgi:hypothetical protein
MIAFGIRAARTALRYDVDHHDDARLRGPHRNLPGGKHRCPHALIRAQRDGLGSLHSVPVLTPKPGAFCNGAPFRNPALLATQGVRRKPTRAADGNRRIVDILSVLTKVLQPR